MLGEPEKPVSLNPRTAGQALAYENQIPAKLIASANSPTMIGPL
jgi:hypothetical protein